MLNLIRESWKQNLDLWIIAIVMFSLFGLLTFEYIFASLANNEWEAFRAAHNCKAIERVESSTNVVVGQGFATTRQYGTGIIPIIEPAKTAWKCDDGITYWK